jgi:hypothetical protein
MTTYQHCFEAEIYVSELNFEMTVDLVCDIIYTPPSKGERDKFGVPLEPDYPEEIEVENIRCNSTIPTPLEIELAEHIYDCHDVSGIIEKWIEDQNNIGDDESLVEYQDRMRGEV